MSNPPDSPSKKWLMRQFWRIQQSQTVISLLFWATTLTLLIYARIEHRWNADDTILNIPTSYFVMGVLYVSVFLIVLFIGWLYDKIFTLWKEHQNVVLERNPWATYQLTPRDAMIVGYLSQIIRAQNADNEKIQKECDWVDKWVTATTELEVFDRMVKELDKILDEPVPELHYLPEGTVSKVRERIKNTEDIL
tara:strand:+ start:353 stop:931 length:579 start_codon:yes stop_codon:yes gene_type:complete